MGKKFFLFAGIGLLGMFGMNLHAGDCRPWLSYDFGKSLKSQGSVQLDLSLPKQGSTAQIADDSLILEMTDGSSHVCADPDEYQKWRKSLDPSEFSACFWIRFDKSFFASASTAKRASFGMFDCYIDDDGLLKLSLFAKPTDLLEDELVMNSRIKAEYGKWYHVEFSYSQNSRRYVLYVDGKFQSENDRLMFPSIRLDNFKIGGNFKGAVKDIKVYGAALDSEELAISDAKEEDFISLKIQAKYVSNTTKNSYIKKWAEQLVSRIESMKDNIGRNTIAQYKRLAGDVGKIQKLDAEITQNADKTISDQVVTAYHIPATTQELFLPYQLPEQGRLTNKIEFYMAQDEYETESVLIVPFQPVKNFTLKMDDLRCGSELLKGSDVDIKLVKRWYRTGGAWMAYHVDLRMRTLTPDLLLHDDKLVRVDEFRRTNEVLFRYPGGEKYSNVSNFCYDRIWINDYKQYFYDAPSLLPLDLTEAGRNQQFMLTFHTTKDTKPGFYTGKLHLIADGQSAGTMDVTLRVLPFVLPQPKTYYNTSLPYFSHVNNHDDTEAGLRNAMEHNMMNLSGVASNPRRLRMSKKVGYPLDYIFDAPDIGKFDFGGPENKMTKAYEQQMEQMMVNRVRRFEKDIEDVAGKKDFTVYSCATSESGWYGRISLEQDRKSNVLHKNTRVKLFSHGMSNAIETFSPGIYDMDSATRMKPEISAIWHAVGGKTITYAQPFPGPENPGLFRRAMGLELYKGCQYDGHMLHGYIGNQLNEFTKYPGGDGDYRTFAMAYCQRDGVINRLPIIGYREGFDDVRYATFMKTQAEMYMNDEDPLIQREAKRQLAWLARVDGYNYDLDAFRSECVFRILAMKKLVDERH